MTRPDVPIPKPPRPPADAEIPHRVLASANDEWRPRRRGKHVWTVLSTGVALALITPRRAWAYLDPGTGSYVLQLAVAAVLGAMVTLRLYWRRVKDWFRGTKPAEKDDQR
jgi:hypothetical protein